VAESQFRSWFSAEARRLGWVRIDTYDKALRAWSDLVEQCRQGYAFGLDEYDNDLGARDLLQLVFGDPAGAADETAQARARVREVDERFRALLRPDVTVPDNPDPDRWWRSGVPARAGEELAADFADRYGIDVTVITDPAESP
jgi:hypothetical protein